MNGALFLVFLALLPLSSSQKISDFLNWNSGEGTWYTQSNPASGTCSTIWSPIPESAKNIDYTVAMNSVQFLGSQACGACLQIDADGTGSGANPIVGPLTVFVTDLCPECPSGNLDFRANPQRDGRWNIKWKLIECPTSAGLAYQFQGSHNYYVKIQVRNQKFPIQSMTVRNREGNYETMVRTTDNFFTAPQGSKLFPVQWPITVKVTSMMGDTVTDEIPWTGDQTKAPADTDVVNGAKNVNFASLSSSSTKASTSTSTKASTSTSTKASTSTSTKASTSTSTKAATSTSTKATTSTTKASVTSTTKASTSKAPTASTTTESSVQTPTASRDVTTVDVNLRMQVKATLESFNQTQFSQGIALILKISSERVLINSVKENNSTKRQDSTLTVDFTIKADPTSQTSAVQASEDLKEIVKTDGQALEQLTGVTVLEVEEIETPKTQGQLSSSTRFYASAFSLFLLSLFM